MLMDVYGEEGGKLFNEMYLSLNTRMILINFFYLKFSSFIYHISRYIPMYEILKLVNSRVDICL